MTGSAPRPEPPAGRTRARRLPWCLALNLVAFPALAQVVPDPPDNLTATHETSNPTLIRVALTWETPDNTGDSPITQACYRYRIVTPTPQSFGQIQCRSASQLGGVNRIVTPHLQGGSKYEFHVALHNGAGQGGWTAVWFTPGVSPTLTIDPTSVAEDAGATVVTVTAALGSRFTLTRNIEVTVSVGDGTATAGTDYGAVDDFTVTIPAGGVSAKGTFTLTPTDDDLDEGNETVEISGSATDLVSIAGAELTITDDDERGLDFSKTGVTVTEASGTGNTATYTVALTSRPTAAVKVVVASNDTDAATVSPDTLRWTAAGWASTKTVTVTGVDDQVDNTPDRTATISHTASGGDYGSVTGSVSVTVTDDEGAPAFSVGDASVAEGDSGEADLDFTVTLSPAADTETTVAWATSDGTATAGSDYTSGSGTLTFAAGETSKTVTVKVTGDAVDEPNETLTLTLSGATGVGEISTATATGTITDDDDTPTVSLALSVSSISENGGSSTVTAALSGASGEAVTVTVTAAAVSPAVPGDFALSSNTTLTIAAGATSSTGTVTVTANDNDLDEADRTVRVSGTASGGHGVADPSDRTLTITDDDDRGLEFSSTSVTVTEAPGTGRTATYTVALTSRPTAAVKVAVGSSDVNAATVSPDTLRWTAAGWADTKTVTVTGVDDEVDNTPDRTATISHTAIGGDYGSVAGSVSVTVTDDEGTSAFSVADASVAEGDSGEADLDFTVTLSPAADMETTVAWATSDGTAAAGSDYTAGNGTLTFAAGETSKTVTVKVTGDAIDEPNETLTLTLSGATGGAGIGTATATGTITDDDDTPTVSLALSPSSISEDGGSSTVTAALSSASGEAVTVTVTAAAVSPAVPGDFALSSNKTLTIAAGATSSTGTVTVTANDNDVDAANRTVRVSGTASGGHGVANPSDATLTIADDDERGLEFSKAGVTVTEASGTGNTATYTVALRSRPTAAVKVAVGSNDAAVATVSSDTLRWAAVEWAATRTVTITGVDDQVDNTPDRTTTISHTAVGGDYGSVTGSVAVTVIDDEGAPAFSVADASVAEGDSGEADLDFTVTLSPPAEMETTVAWATSDGTATAGSDYTAGSGTLTFAAGETSKTVTVKVTGDAIDEPDETLTLSGATGGPAISTATATGTITDDDDTPSGAITLSVNPTSVAEAASATTVTVTATLPGSTTRNAATALTVSVGASGDAATEGTDYATVSDFTLSIAAGQISGMATFSIDPVQDAVNEGAGESVSVAGSTSVSGFTVTGTSLTITDDDQPYVLHIDAIPACGATVSDTSVRPSFAYVLTPAPAERVYVEYRVVTETTTRSWVSGTSLPIEPESGRSIRFSFGTFAELQQAYAGFKGFEYRLKDTPAVTAQCTWRFDDDGGTTPPTPTVSLSASPNPVDEGSSVTVTARLSAALSNAVTIPLAVTAGTAESGDFGALASITIAGGSATGTGTITTSEDADTDDETFTVALGSLPSSVRAGSPSSVPVRIRDADGGTTPPTPTVSLSASPNPVDEGSSVTVTARLSAVLSNAVTIPLAVTAGTAESGDFGALASITIAGGSATGTGTITTSEDADTDDETFTVALGSLPSSVRAGSPRSVTVTILDDDDPVNERGVTVTPTELELVEGESDVYRIGLTSQPTAPVTVSVAVTRAGSDVMVSPAALSFTPEDWRIQQPVLVRAAHDDDALTDPTTTIRHRLTGGDYENFPAPTVSVAVVEDDSPTIAVADARAVEGAGEIVFSVTLDTATDREVRIRCTTLAGTATEGLDYLPMDGILVIPPFKTEAEVVVRLLDDTGDEPAETFILQLSRPVNASQAPGSLTATGTILDDDLPEVAISAVASPVAEGADARFRLSRAGDPSGSLHVPIRVAETGSFMAGPAPSAMTFAAGEGEVVLALPTLDDLLDERDGEIRATLAESPDYGVSGPGSAVVAITDNDATPALAVADASVPENAGVIEFPVSLQGASAYGVTVRWSTADLTATAGEDYEAATGTLTLAPGETSGRVRTAVIDDALPEEDETFTLVLSGPENAVLEADRATGTITDDDEAAAVAWLSRFGRTVASQVVDGVTGRLEGALDGGGFAGALRQLPSGGPDGDRTGLGDLLAGSSFLYSTANGARTARSGGGIWTIWGRGARTEFSGVDGDLPVQGSVLTGLAGADYERGRMLAGVAVLRSLGDGAAGAAPGASTEDRVESALSGAYPYLRFRLAERISTWALAGLGRGDISFPGADGEGNAIRMRMGAVGARGELLRTRGGGFGIALKSDAFTVRMSSEPVGGSSLLADSERARILLEASGRGGVGESGVLGTTVEVGVRHDGGDAETGTGLEAGGGLEYVNARAGLRVEASVRALVSHQDADFREWGVGGSIVYEPGGPAEGLSLRMGMSSGAAESAIRHLWSSPHAARELAARAQARDEAGRGSGARVDAEIHYAFAAFGDRLAMAPFVRLRTDGAAGGGSSRVGWRFVVTESARLALETDVMPADAGGAGRGLALRASLNR